MSIEPVVGDETDPYAIRKEDLPQIFEEYDKLAKLYDPERKGRKRIQFLSFYDRSGRRSLYCQNVFPDVGPAQSTWQ